MSLRKSSRKRKKSPPNKNTLNSSNTETKLSRIAIHYEYLFEWGVDFKNRIITIDDEIDSNTFSKLDSALTEMENESRKAVTVKINSPGGSVYDALAIVGRLRNSPCRIITEGYGCIMSAATLILACGDKRRVSSLSWFMHHEAYYGVEGRHKQVVNEVKQREREEAQWAKAMARFTKKDVKFWAKKGIHIDAYFEASELKDLGVVDEVMEA